MTKVSNRDLQEENTQSAISMAVIANDISYIKKSVGDIQVKLEGDYVTKEAFGPVRNITFGLVALILVAVVGALVTLVLK